MRLRKKGKFKFFYEYSWARVKEERLKILLSPVLGRVLTLADATFNDPQQRKAFKDVVKEIFYSYDYHLSATEVICELLGEEWSKVSQIVKESDESLTAYLEPNR